MDISELLDKTKKALRSLLISTPRGVPVRLILKDYKMVMGKELPLRNLGFHSVDEFLKSLPDVVRIAPGATGEPTLFPIADAKTQQIARFVASQKKPRIKKSPFPLAMGCARRPSKVAGFSTKSKFGTSRQRGTYTSGSSSWRSGHQDGGRWSRAYNPPPLNTLAKFQSSNSSRIPALHSLPVFQSANTFYSSRQPELTIDLNSISSSSSSWKPEQRTASSATSVRTVRTYGGSIKLSMWKEEYRSAQVVTIKDLKECPAEMKRLSIVTVTGYVCTSPRMDKVENSLRYLLYSALSECQTDTDGYGCFPAVMVVFQASTWDVKKYPEVAHIRPSTKLKVCGQPFHTINLKKKSEYGIWVYYYEEVSQQGVSHDKDVRAITPASSLSPSPLSPSPTSPSTTLVSATVKKNIYALLEKHPQGMYFGSFENEYKKRFERDPPSAILQILHSLPFVMWDVSAPSQPMISLKSSPGFTLPQARRQHNGDSNIQSVPFLPSETLSTMQGNDLVSTSLKTHIFELLKANPRGVYTSRLSKVYENMFKKAPPKNIIEIARTLPFVFYEEEVPGHPVVYLNEEPTISTESERATPVLKPSVQNDLVSTSLKTQIFELLKANPHGVYASKLSRSYEDMFKKAPPKSIIKIIQTLPFASYEEGVPGYPIVCLKEETTVLTESERATPVLKPSVQAISTASKTTHSPSEETSVERSFSSMSLGTEKPPLPPTASFDGEDSEMFDVMVVYINSVTSFYVQIIDKEYLEKFQCLVNDMCSYFSKGDSNPVSSVNEDQLYGYLWTEAEGDVWCRCLVRNVSGSQATVMFPDYGNSDLVEIKNLKELPESSYKLPFQAIHCCLHGITEEAINESFRKLALETTCIAQVMDSSGSRVAVELMSSDPVVHETINSILLKEAHPISTLEPLLPEPNEPMVPINLTDIEMDGVVIIQVKGPGLNQLQQLMTVINDTYMNKVFSANDFVSSVLEDSVYCSKYTDKKWYRVQVKKVVTPKVVTVKYVDYGNEDVIEKTKLRKPVDTELFSLPFQIVRCSLHGLPPEGGVWTDVAIRLLWSYIENEDLHAAVVEKGSGDVLPSIILFFSQPKGEIMNLNDWLLDQREAFRESLPEEVLEENEKSISSMGFTNVASRKDSTNSPNKAGELSPSTVPVERHPSSESGGVARGVVSPDNENHSEGSPKVISNENSPVIKQVDTVQNNSADELQSPLQLQPTTSLTNTLSSQQNTLSILLSPPPDNSIAGPLHNLSISCVHSQNSSISPHTPSQGSSISPHTPSQGSSISPHTPSQGSSISPHTPSGSSSPPHTPSQSSSNSLTLSQSSIPVNGTSSQGSLISSMSSGTNTPDFEPPGQIVFASLVLNDPILVCISWVESPSDFVVQLTSNISSLEDLMESLNQLLNMSAPLPLPSSALRPGFVCCAKSSIDDRWCRTRVVGPQVTSRTDNGVENTEVVVEFLDYGGSEGVQRSCLRAIPLMYTQFPFQGIKCCLDGVVPKGGVGSNWSQEALDFFADYIDRKFYVLCKSARVGQPCGLVVLDTKQRVSSDNQKDNIINHELVTRGYADSTGTLKEL